MTEQPTHEDVIRLEGALHLMRFALDRLIKAEHKPAPEYLRDLLDRVTDDPGEPCDRDAQYARAERAEAALARVRALADRLDEFAENALKTSDRDLYAALARDIRNHTAPAATAATRPADQPKEQ